MFFGVSMSTMAYLMQLVLFYSLESFEDNFKNYLISPRIFLEGDCSEDTIKVQRMLHNNTGVSTNLKPTMGNLNKHFKYFYHSCSISSLFPWIILTASTS